MNYKVVIECPFPRMGGGDPACVYDDAEVYGLFPAWAGVIPTRIPSAILFTAFPRMGGGDPYRMEVYHLCQAFPRMGGGDPSVEDNVQALGALFPAWAGVIPGG